MTRWYQTVIIFAMTIQRNKMSFIRLTKLPSITVVSLLIFLSSSCSTSPSQKNQIEAAHINVKLGLLYLQQNQVEIAKSKLLLACKQAPRDAEVHDALGYFFSHTGELNAATKQYLYAIKLADEKGVFWHNYGKFLYQQGYYQRALEYFLRAARDFNYLYVGDAYADASKAAGKLRQDNLAKKYHTEGGVHGAAHTAVTRRLTRVSPY